MVVGHAADESLSLALGHRDHKARRLARRLAGGEHDLGNPAAQVAAEVEPRATAELTQLQLPELRHRLVFADLTGDEPAQHVPHRPSKTSRIRCQCVPAQ